jgi:hypothetical protein
MPIDWEEPNRCGDRERAIIAHALADMTVEHERQIAELKRDVESLNADHPARTCRGSATSSTAHWAGARSLSIASIAVRSNSRAHWRRGDRHR